MEQNNQTPNKYVQAFADSKVETNDAVVAAEVEKIVSQHMAENDNKQVYEFLLNCVDLTTLSTTDSERSVAAFTQKVNDYFKNAESDDIKTAMEELGEDYYDEIHVRLVRIQFHCDLGN